MTAPALLITLKPRAQPPASRSQPTTGAAAAPPRVSAEPCQPIASPRTHTGTARVRSATVAVMVGAQKRPDRVSSTMNSGLLGAIATAAVVVARQTRSTAEDGGRCSAP